MKKILNVIFIVLFTFILYPKASVFATRASLLCEPASGTYNVGDTITVNYKLDTRSYPTNGADIVATYTSSVLEAQGNQSTASTTDTHWTAPTTNTIDATLGKIRLDYGKAQTAYTGTGTLGQATFTAKAAGQAQFNFVFFQQYDDTTIDGGAAKVWGVKTQGAAVSNILTDVTNCIYVIAAAGPTSTPGPTTPVVTALPRSGSTEVTMSLFLLAAIFVGGGLIFPLYVYSRK